MIENIQKIDQARIPANATLNVFIGTKQHKLPMELVKLREALGDRFEWIRIDGNGPNALDFHIACHLGEGLARTPQTEFMIISGDSGFDPLLRHLKTRDLHCRREAPATPAKAAPKQVLDANAQQVVELIRRTDKNKRPRKRKTLTTHLVNHFQK